jgi:hypothetical protein
MDETLRPDLHARMLRWAAASDLCLAMGTSLCGMEADATAATVAARAGAGEAGVGGLVIVNLQRTPMDAAASLRIYARCDDVMAAVAREMRLRLRSETLDEPHWRK